MYAVRAFFLKRQGQGSRAGGASHSGTVRHGGAGGLQVRSEPTVFG